MRNIIIVEDEKRLKLLLVKNILLKDNATLKSKSCFQISVKFKSKEFIVSGSLCESVKFEIWIESCFILCIFCDIGGKMNSYVLYIF